MSEQKIKSKIENHFKKEVLSFSILGNRNHVFRPEYGQVSPLPEASHHIVSIVFKDGSEDTWDVPIDA